MVEDAVETETRLIDIVIGKNVSFRDGGIPTMVGDTLRAGKSALLREARSSSRYERVRLIIAKPAKKGLLAGDVVIDANIKFAFI